MGTVDGEVLLPRNGVYRAPSSARPEGTVGGGEPRSVGPGLQVLEGRGLEDLRLGVAAGRSARGGPKHPEACAASCVGFSGREA
jgi:hypothetical protein